ncbi:MAG: DUF3465 domain-containing protein [Pseudomonadales bacterium]
MLSLRKLRKTNWLALAVLIGGALLLRYFEQADNSSPTKAPGIKQSQDGFETLKQAVAQQRSEVWFAETQFKLRKELEDDNYGDRHQRFLVERAGLPSLLVAHNIDLAPRAPLSHGMTIYIKGRYEWNEKGGVIHWTHHDPQRREPGGWLRVGKEKYF